MFGGITKHEIKVLAAAIIWWKNMADKPSTDILWETLNDMMLERPTKRVPDVAKSGAKKGSISGKRPAKSPRR